MHHSELPINNLTICVILFVTKQRMYIVQYVQKLHLHVHTKVETKAMTIPFLRQD